MKKNAKLSLVEAAKLLQWAPATLKKRIEDGSVKAKTTQTGKKVKYEIAKSDLPRRAHGASKVTKEAPVVRRRARRTPVAPAASAQIRFVSEPFTRDETLSPADAMLRSCFLQWASEKLLGK